MLYEFAKRWIEDPSIDPSFSATIFEAGEEDAWDDPATWLKANPAAGAFRSLEELATAAKRAKQIPSEQDAFKRYYLNQWTAQESSWLDMAAWDACAAQREDATLLGCEAYFGLDLSAVADLTALTGLFPVDEKTVLRSWAWIPEDGVKEREDRERVPYRKWIEKGLLETCPGSAIDHDFITDRVIAICQKYQTMRVSFDRWGSTAVSQRLTDSGLTMVPIGQGFASLSAPTKAMQAAILRNELEHDGSALLRWQATNCTVIADPAGNIKMIKHDRLRHRKHIDSVVAAAMAFDGLMRKGPSLDDFISNPIGL